MKTIALVASLLAVAVCLWLNLQDEVPQSMPAEREQIERLVADSTKELITTPAIDNLETEEKISRDLLDKEPENSEDIISEKKHSVVIKKLEPLHYIENLRQFIDEKPLSERRAIERLSLAKELATCGFQPLKAPDKLEETINEYYYSQVPIEQSESYQKAIEDCLTLTDKEIKSATNIIIEEALKDNFVAINMLPYALPPEHFTWSLSGYDDEYAISDEQMANFRQHLRENIFPIIEDSILMGNLEAARFMALELRSSVIIEQDYMRSLSYYLALNKALQTNKWQKDVVKLSKSLSEEYIKKAEQNAQALFEQWDSVYINQ
ncbi:MAG: hypothetical protein AAGB12_06770 [Pseudomonadota bacterium]